jgi:HEPN domain-containing protein
MSDDHTKQERIDYWMNLAQYDLDTAEAMLKTGRLLYVGFMCHQVIEKALKGQFEKTHDEMPPYTHNLSFLAKESGLLHLLSEEQKKLIALLQPLNVESRYPSFKEKILQTLDDRRCDDIVKETGRLFQWIKER